MTTSAWHVQLLGGAQLHSEHGASANLERKAAALLAYLALEGSTRRAHLTALLWPDTREASARNNLVHLLRKLRSVTSVDLVTGAEALSLAEHLRVDVLSARTHFTRAEYDALAALDGELLQGLVYDDCADLDDWVHVQRDRLREWRATALRETADRFEREGDLGSALRTATALLALDTVSEDAWRRVMRLHYLRGDRPAALKAYRKCQETLARELGVEPLPETKELARLVDQGRVTPPRTAKPSIPLAVLRPPRIVGRDAQWTTLEAAWDAGRILYLHGEPGSGKTRLAQEFAASKGETVVFAGRPGDANVPRSTSARNFRVLRSLRPDVTLEPWVRREMSRLLPELAAPDEVVSPLGSDADLLRFRSAMGAFFRAHAGGIAVVLADDLQFYDEASAQDVTFLFSTGELDSARLVGAYRTGELGEAVARDVERLVDDGAAVRVSVAPLGRADVDALLDDVGVPRDAALREKLAEFAGGNPLFLLEIVKHLIEADQLHADAPERLPSPEKVRQLIGRRLTRLSSAASNAARAAAILQSDFDLEQVADVLGAPLLNVAEAWEELEAAQVVHGERFSHDLVYEAVRDGIPPSVRQLLHRSAARALAERNAPPARVARHWLEGGNDRAAFPLLMQAARAAHDTLRLLEAAEFQRAASEAAARVGRTDLAFDAAQARAETLGHLGDRDAREQALRAAFDVADAPLRRARAWQLQAELHLAYHEGELTEQAAREGLRALDEAPERTTELAEQRARLEASVGTALWLQGRVEDAATALRGTVTILEELGESASLAANLSNLGVILDHLDRHREASECHRRACALFERLHLLPDLGGSLHNLAVNLLEQGEARGALAAALRAHDIEARTDGDPLGMAVSHANIGQAHVALGQYDLALKRFELAGRAAPESRWFGAYFAALAAEVWLLLGGLDEAERELARSADLAGAPPAQRSRALVARGWLAAARGETAEAWFDEASRTLGETPRPLALARMHLVRARFASPPEAFEIASSVRSLALASDLGGVHLAATARLAEAALALGRLDEAARAAEAGRSALDAVEPTLATRAEVLLALARAFEAAGAADAAECRALAEAWLRDTVSAHVPPEVRATFAARHATLGVTS